MEQNQKLPSNSKNQMNNEVENRMKSGVKRRSPISKFAELFFKEDGSTIKRYIIEDVVVPSVTDAIVDSCKGAIEMLFYGKTRRGRDSSYQRDYTKSFSGVNRPTRSVSTMRVDPKDCYVYSPEDADVAIDKMFAVLKERGEVTVADFFEAIERTGNGYTDNYYGWKDIRDITFYERTEYVKGGEEKHYYFNLPRIVELR